MLTPSKGPEDEGMEKAGDLDPLPSVEDGKTRLPELDLDAWEEVTDKETEGEYSGPEWTCVGCGNRDRHRIKWHRSGGYFEPPEYDPECLECGGSDIEESPIEALHKVINQRDDLYGTITALQAEIAELKAPAAGSPTRETGEAG